MRVFGKCLGELLCLRDNVTELMDKPVVHPRISDFFVADFKLIGSKGLVYQTWVQI